MFSAVSDIQSVIDTLGDSDVYNRIQAVRVLGLSYDERAFVPLLGALKDPEASVRVSAIQALWRFSDMRTIESLIQMLDDPSSDARAVSAAVLGDFKDRRAVAPLVAVLSDSNPHVRFQASISLGQIGGPAIPTLLQLLLDEKHEKEVRRALYGLNKINSIDILLMALNDKDYRIRVYAAEFLMQFDDEDVMVKLQEALHDPDESVRYHASVSLDVVKSKLSEREQI